jgi:hypothetical protein
MDGFFDSRTATPLPAAPPPSPHVHFFATPVMMLPASYAPLFHSPALSAARRVEELDSIGGENVATPSRLREDQGKVKSTEGEDPYIADRESLKHPRYSRRVQSKSEPSVSGPSCSPGAGL